MTEHKPCPFCGAAVADEKSRGQHADDCYFTLHKKFQKSPTDRELHCAVISAWDRRADATCALRGADEARQFPDNTCPASRHAQMIGEALVKGEAFPELSEEPGLCGQSILATVGALYRARTAHAAPGALQQEASGDTFRIDECEEAFVRDFCPYKGNPDPLIVWRAAWKSSRAAATAPADATQLPDPLGCRACTHPDCGRFDGPRQVECRAMASNACARKDATAPADALVALRKCLAVLDRVYVDVVASDNMPATGLIEARKMARTALEATAPAGSSKEGGE
jgi:hypothetical protein